MRNHQPNGKVRPGKVQRKGMTLLEILAVVTIAGLLLAVVLPRLSAIREQMLIDTTAHGLARDLTRARSEALKRNESVTVRRLADTAYQVGTEAPRLLPPSLKFTSGPSVDSVRFAPFGLVVVGVGKLMIKGESEQKQVIVRPSGHVRVE